MIEKMCALIDVNGTVVNVIVADREVAEEIARARGLTAEDVTELDLRPSPGDIKVSGSGKTAKYKPAEVQPETPPTPDPVREKRDDALAKMKSAKTTDTKLDALIAYVTAGE